MSKHLGNAVPVRRLIDKHGADALRVAILWAAGPQRTIDWRPELIDRASGFLDRVYRVTYRSAEVLRGPDTSDSHATSSRAVGRLGSTCRRAAARVGRLIEDYRPNAALDVLGSVLGEIEGFALHRIDTCRVEPADRAELRGALAQYCIALSPFAPFVTEELWHALGESSLVSGAAWVRR
jgi:leucyl-tRNA synthetase